VEVPNALPLILGGLRNATLQVVATATVAAYASLGGLGRYLIDGIKEREFQLALVGALLVAALALILDGLLAGAVWMSAPGTGRLRRPVRRRNHVTPTALADKPAAVAGHVLR
jgi:osmoprotectant transport system permease protein